MLYFIREFLSLYYDALIEILTAFIIFFISKSYFLFLYLTEGKYDSVFVVVVGSFSKSTLTVSFSWYSYTITFKVIITIV